MEEEEEEEEEGFSKLTQGTRRRSREMPAPTCYKTSNEGGEEEESFISRLTRGVKGLSRKGTRGGHESGEMDIKKHHLAHAFNQECKAEK